MKRGKYELKKRAERQEDTRLRIARATLELHEILGPALTTRSAIAERAGVTRPTVYSHFPDDLSLGKACSSLELSDNPLPDPRPWQEIADPERRLRVALGELYAYFRRRERLWTNILRDQEMPLTNDDPEAHEADAEIMEPIFLHWEQMKETLAGGWGSPDEPPRLLLSAIGLALDFHTWRAMVRTQDLTDEQAIELMVGMARCAAVSPDPGSFRPRSNTSNF
jgi:AcrR family transcriptional regulator